MKRLPTSQIEAMVYDARRAALAFVAGLDHDQLMGPKLRIVNPILWEIGHIAWFQEYFILRLLDGRKSLRSQADAIYDSAQVAHDDRWDLPLPTLEWTIQYGLDVQEAILARLSKPLVSEQDSYFYQLVTFHADMHTEAFSYTRQTLGLPRVDFNHDSKVMLPPSGPWPGDASIPGGTFKLGAHRDAHFVFDNEKWAHDQTVEPFSIARAAVTNVELAAFVESGGYTNRTFWTEEGWSWLQGADVQLPSYWTGKPGKWRIRHFDTILDLAPNHPVMYVNWHEANAYCAFAKRRLPTELEWEVAATGEPGLDPTTLRPHKRQQPWVEAGSEVSLDQHANLDGNIGGLADVSAFGKGDSAFGCRQMMGNVWEWTTSDFVPYPGFSADAYRDYSEPWFGSRKVLRGGCWATRSRLVTPVYRNFFTPDRRDIFAGFRTCALT